MALLLNAGDTVQRSYSFTKPSPTHISLPEECGDRTGQVMSSPQASTKTKNGVTCTCDGQGTFTLKGTASEQTQFEFNVQEFTTPVSVGQGGAGTLSLFNTFASSNIRILFFYNNTKVDEWILTPIGRASTAYRALGEKQVNKLIIKVQSGTTVDGQFSPMMTDDGQLPETYEPFGYKIPVTCAGQTSPIYLSEPLRKIGDYADTVSSDGTVTRRIGVIEVNGSNIGGFEVVSGLTSIAKMRLTDIQSSDLQYAFLCSHFAVRRAGEPWTAGLVYNSYSAYYNLHFGLPIDIEDISAAREWFNAKYSNGTPVTVWYVLATPTTETITAPTIPTAKGANTLTVDTTLQPSAVSVTGNIKQA